MGLHIFQFRESEMKPLTGRWFPVSVRLVLTVLALTLIAPVGFSIDRLAAQSSAAAATTPDPLGYSNGFLITGNYLVSSIDLPKAGGLGTFSFTDRLYDGGVEVVAAYLYWETISRGPIPFSNVKFRDAAIVGAKASTINSLPGLPAANCWGSAGGASSTLTMFRADVLSLLEKQLDSKGKWTGRHLITDADLKNPLLPVRPKPYTVMLPQQGTGNVLTQSAGASLVLLYRKTSDRLRKIVIYDGVYAQAQGTTMSLTMKGFYQSVQDDEARLTHIVGSGAANSGERLLVSGVNPVLNPFPGPIGGGADRGWASYTVPMAKWTPGTEAGYGETVTTSVDHGARNQNSTPYECLSWAATIFSTAVADDDKDGLPDGIEAATAGLKDPPTLAFPTGRPLPNLNAMGAKVGPKDLFVEINAMRAAPLTKYGSADAPLNAVTSSVTDAVGHNHLPRPEVLKLVGDAYKNGGITAHFDVGNTTTYHAGEGYSCPAGQNSCDADEYLVPSDVARGGEIIQERACAGNDKVKCQFSDYPGTVGWKLGVQLYKDAPVDNAGAELSTPAAVQKWGTLNSNEHRRRFDQNREDFFHYVLYAHARGQAKSPLPCLDGNGGYTNTQTHSCSTPTNNNPLFKVPTSASGIADLPGNTAMITLGLWDNFVGTTFMQASTTLHELGHNLNLWHGGAPAVWGNSNSATTVEPNCKPNYLSSMSYLYQAHGLIDSNGDVHIDYSGAPPQDISENVVADGALLPAAKYQSAWYAPLYTNWPKADPALLEKTQLESILGVPQSTRFCDGGKFKTDAPPVPTVRLHAVAPLLVAGTPSFVIDWNGDGMIGTSVSQDLNFDGTQSTALKGYDDWSNVRLNQIGAGRTVRIFPRPGAAGGDFLDFGSGDFLDFGAGDFLDFGSGDFLDFGAGTYYVDFSSGDFLDFGAGDFLDFGSGDFLDFGSGVFLTDSSGTNVGAAGDFLDFGAGDFLDFGSGDFLDFGSGDFLDFGAGDFLDFGAGDFLDFGAGAFGAGDFLDFGAGSLGQELDYDAARLIGRAAPSGLKACVIGQDCPTTTAAAGDPLYHRIQLRWATPTVGIVQSYQVYRITGDAVTPANVASLVPIASAIAATTFIDPEELPNGVKFTYFVKATYDDANPITGEVLMKTSGASNFAIITAIDDAPGAVIDSYTVTANQVLTVPCVVAPCGVLSNDTDVDTLKVNNLLTALRVVAPGTFPTPHGTVVLKADGSFVYTPVNGYSGSDTFTYTADDGRWSRDKLILLSGPSNVGVVNITVKKGGK
jgi:hypothetical protein